MYTKPGTAVPEETSSLKILALRLCLQEAFKRAKPSSVVTNAYARSQMPVAGRNAILSIVALLYCSSASWGQSIYLKLETLAKHSDDLEYRFADRQGKDVRVHYRLFCPTSRDVQREYPLIIWLHGWGDRGDDNISQLMHLNATIYETGYTRDCAFFLLAPQCSRTPSREWHTPLSGGNDDMRIPATNQDMLDVTLNILDRIERQYPVDRRRVTLVGISSGANACWDLLCREPNRFAAVAPLGGGGAPAQLFATQLRTPVWAFHATADPEVPISGVSGTIEKLQSVGASAILTQTNDTRHECWTKAFAQHDLLYWLLAQRQNDPSSPLPGRHRLPVEVSLWWSDTWPALTLLTAVTSVAWISYRQIKKSDGVQYGGLISRATPGYERPSELLDNAAELNLYEFSLHSNFRINVPDFTNLESDK